MSEKQESQTEQTQSASRSYAARYDVSNKLKVKLAKVMADWLPWQHDYAEAGIDGRSSNPSPRCPVEYKSADI